jgi:hypothetical protein
MAGNLLLAATIYSGFRGRDIGVDANSPRDDRFREMA